MCYGEMIEGSNGAGQSLRAIVEKVPINLDAM